MRILEAIKQLKVQFFGDDGENVPASDEGLPQGLVAGRKLAWIPWAEDWYPRHAKRWAYPNGFPEGAIIHYTAGGSIESSMSQGNKDGYTFLGIGRDGTVYQSHPLTHGGHHCGTWHHRTRVGIEMASAGLVASDGPGFKSWFGSKIEARDVRRIASRDANRYPGHYHMYTEPQESALIELLMWLKAQAPDIFDFDKVIGHDEACEQTGTPGRKQDPGGALSFTMPRFREFLKEEWARRMRA